MKWATYLFPRLTYLNNKKKLYSPEIHERIMRYHLLNYLWVFAIWLLYSPIAIPAFILLVFVIIFETLSKCFDWLADKLINLAVLFGSHKFEKRRLAWVQTKRAWIKKLEHDQEDEEPTGI